MGFAPHKVRGQPIRRENQHQHGPPAIKSGLQRSQAEARNIPDQPRQRLRDVGPRRPARDQLAQHGRVGAARRRDGVRGAGAGCTLGRFRRRHQSAGAGLRGLHLGGRDQRRHQENRRGVDLARLAQSSDHLGQAMRGDRSHLQRTLYAQHRVRLERPRDGYVQHPAAGARGALRMRGGMALNRQAAVDAGRDLRSQRQVLHHPQRAIWRPSRCSSPIRRS